MEPIGAVVLDTETTGLGPRARIVELAVVDLYTGQTILDTMIAPGIEIPEEVTLIHELDAVDLESAPGWSEVRPVVQEILARTTLAVGYNLPFDLDMISQTNYGWGQSALTWPDGHCVMHDYARHNGDWSEYHGNYRWVKLVDAVDALGVPTWPVHSALSDARASRIVALRLSATRLRMWSDADVVADQVFRHSTAMEVAVMELAGRCSEVAVLRPRETHGWLHVCTKDQDPCLLCGAERPRRVVAGSGDLRQWEGVDLEARYCSGCIDIIMKASRRLEIEWSATRDVELGASRTLILEGVGAAYLPHDKQLLRDVVNITHERRERSYRRRHW